MYVIVWEEINRLQAWFFSNVFF